MVVMRRCLVIANRTLLSAELREELRQRIESGPSSFYVLVPNTSAADYQIPADSGVLPPSLAWWATNYRGPATDEEATAQARERLGETLADLAGHGRPAEGDLRRPRPLGPRQKGRPGRPGSGPANRSPTWPGTAPPPRATSAAPGRWRPWRRSARTICSTRSS